jgi:uncharacterized protein (DUF2147 family)
MADDDPDDELEIEEPEAVEPEDLAEPEEPVEPEEGAPKEPDEPLAAREAPVDRQPSRRDTRIQTLTDEARQAKTELAETRRRLDELSRQMTQPRPSVESPEQRAARFALMTPQEQMTETLRESEQRIAAMVQQTQVQSYDAADRAAFQAKAAVDPLYAKWGPKVEGKLAELRAKGNNVERDVLLKFLIGEAALEKRGSKEGRQEVRQAKQRVANQRTRSTNSGSDTAPQRRQQSTVERRLEDVQI